MRRALVCWIVGALLALLAAESLLRLLPTPTATLTGYYVDPAILSYPPRHRWRVATGWDLRNPQTLIANNLGFPAGRDFVPDANAVALIGDSYVEASMLEPRDRPGAQLERALGGGRPVYALGGPGSSLLDYAERVRFVRQHLAVRDVVILMEAGDVRQALCRSGNVHSACLDRRDLRPRTERRGPPSALARIARHSALAQYFVGQLRLTPAALLAATFRRTTKSPPAAPAVVAASAPPFVAAVSDAFVERVRREGLRRMVIVVDGQRDPTRPLEPALTVERRGFMERARAAGFAVVDAEPIYAAHARNSARSLDVGPYDGHLNPLGVGLAMQAAARALRGEGPAP